MTELNDGSDESRALKGRVGRALRTTEERCRDVADAVELALAEAATRADEAADSSLASVTDLIRGAIDEVAHAGSELGEFAKGISAGVLRSTRRKGSAALQELSHASRTVMCHTAAAGGDMAAAARGIVRGAIQCAQEWGLDAAQAASSAARGVLEVTEDLGTAALQGVRQALSEKIDGVQVFLDRPSSGKEKP